MSSGKDSRRSSVKHEDEHKSLVLGFLKTLFSDHPASSKIWMESIRPQVFHDYCYYLERAEYEEINKISLYFMIEQNFGFLFEGNVENLTEASAQSLEAFFKPNTATFTFVSNTWGLAFGDSVLEAMKDKILESKASISSKIEIMEHYLMTVDRRSDLDRDFIIDVYCQYVDLLLTRCTEDDLQTAEKTLNNVLLTKCRKDSFEMVDSNDQCVPLLKRLVLDIHKNAKEATKVMQQIIDVSTTHLGEIHCNHAYMQDLTAKFFESQGVNELALSCLSSCSKVIEATVGRDHYSRVPVSQSNKILRRMAKIYTVFKDSLNLAKESLLEVDMSQ